MRQVVGLDHLRQRLALGGDPESLGGGLRRRRLVPQRLPQAPNAPIRERRAEEHRYNLNLAQSARQVSVDLLLWRLDILEQLLEQRIVEIGELFDQIRSRGAFLVPKIVR